MSHRQRSAAFAIAGTVYLAAVTTTLLWDSLFRGVPFALFFAAVTAAAWYGGFLPGILVALAAAIHTAYLT